MNLEGITINVLISILQQRLLGGKIYKIFMPNKNCLLLLVKTENSTLALAADFSGGSPYLYLPDKTPERPDTPPAFCMLLRKHLEEGRITRIEQSGLDRVITMEISSIGSARQIISKQLVFELTGKNANIIFTADGVILDSLKHVNKTQSSYRQILPGLTYIAPPPQDGLDILTAAPQDIASAAQQLPLAPTKALIATATGIGQYTANQLLKMAGLTGSENLAEENISCLAGAIADMQQNVNSVKAGSAPVYAIITRTSKVKTILPFKPVLLAEGETVKEFGDLNTAINYAQSLAPVQLPEQEILTKTVNAETEKLIKKATVLKEELAAAEDAEQQRIIADTLMANLYRIKKGSSECTVENIYDGTPLTIALAPDLTANENAQKYYKRYNKLKRAQTEIKEQLKLTEEAVEYLGSIDIALKLVQTRAEVAEIKAELAAAGFITVKNTKNKMPQAKSAPTVIKLSADTTLYIGKNNKQNDYVTFSAGSGNDLWFHTKNIPGSHVILKTSLPAPDNSDIKTAASLAAYFSKARGGSNVPVDSTLRKFVKKPSGAKPGFVIYTNQTTYYVTPDEEAIQTLLK